MRKIFLTVAASVLLGALAVLPQAPDGAAPAGKGRGGAPPAGNAGPDAVAAGLVNTVCASCHSLDRINSKKGDNAAWTSTVANMKGKGAALTDEQVTLLAEYLVRTAGSFTVTLTAPDGAAKGGGKGGGGKGGKGGGKGGGGFAAKNLKVLTAAALPAAMQGLTPLTAAP
jgi:cytochrome c5